MKSLHCLFFFLVIGLPLGAIAQQSTSVVVRAKAKDAKFIGSSMGGAFVTIQEVSTGRILAEGITRGSTGDTGILMRDSHTRYEQLSTEGAARFAATIELAKPVFVEITASAPVAQKQSQVTASTQLWLIPGRDITGDGILLEIPGFAIDILQPQAHEVKSEETIKITANAVMMCGCPISPAGLWDSDKMEFTAVVTKGDRKIARKKMVFSGKTSTFESTFVPPESGAYQIMVYGYDSRTGNTGLDRTTVVVN